MESPGIDMPGPIFGSLSLKAQIYMLKPFYQKVFLLYLPRNISFFQQIILQSVLKLFAGLTFAAFIVCIQISNAVINPKHRIEMINGSVVILILYA